MKSLFITFEGIEGSGKSTQIKLLEEYLRGKDFPVLSTQEPGGTFLGRSIRKILLDPDQKQLAPLAELLLYASDRAQHCEEVIRPALRKNILVLSDRFTDSTIAYQEGGRNLPASLIAQANSLATQGLKPDLTFLIDCPVELGLKRAHGRALLLKKESDRIEKETTLFHERVRERYLKLAAEEPARIRILNGERQLHEIQEEIRVSLPFEVGT